MKTKEDERLQDKQWNTYNEGRNRTANKTSFEEGYLIGQKEGCEEGRREGEIRGHSAGCDEILGDLRRWIKDIEKIPF